MLLKVSSKSFYLRSKTPLEEEKEMSGCSRCCLCILIILAEIFLHGCVALTLYWIFQYRWDGEGVPFTWHGTEGADLEKLWNLHPVLMVTGFVYCMGQGKTEGIWFYLSQSILSNHRVLVVSVWLTDLQ